MKKGRGELHYRSQFSKKNLHSTKFSQKFFSKKNLKNTLKIFFLENNYPISFRALLFNIILFHPKNRFNIPYFHVQHIGTNKPFGQVFEIFISNTAIHRNLQKNTSGLFCSWFI